MKFHILSQSESSNGSRHARFESEIGRVREGLMRIEEWREDFPDDPNLFFGEAFIRSEYLGQAGRARALYQRAYETHPGVSGGLAIDFGRDSAGGNVALFARNFDEYRQWSKFKKSDLAELTSELSAPGQFAQFTLQRALHRHEAGNLGDAACLLEIALNAGIAGNVQEEVKFRRMRAQFLRGIDTKLEQSRSARGESYPGSERLSLMEALTEVDRALAFDQFDAELWNLRAAWLVLLERFAEALAAAEQSMELRPGAYAKPIVNKAIALLRLGDASEASRFADLAQQAAEESGDRQDAALVENVRKQIGAANSPPGSSDFSDWANGVFCPSAFKVGEDEAFSVRMSTMIMTGGYLRRNAVAGPGFNFEQVQGLAELLTDHTAELAFGIMGQISRQEPERFRNMLEATRYLGVFSDGIVRLDAVRLLVLNLLFNRDLKTARSDFRKFVLIPCEAARQMTASPVELGRFDEFESLVRLTLEGIQPWLPGEVLDGQALIRESEIKSVSSSVLFQALEGSAVKRKTWTPRGYLKVVGCLFVGVLFMGCASWTVVKGLEWLGSFFPHAAANTEKLGETPGWGIGLLVLLPILVIWGVMGRLTARALRQTQCARCQRALMKSPEISLSPGRMLFNTEAMLSGQTGPGKECPSCGRIFCTQCDDFENRCVCGYNPMIPVRLDYRTGGR